MSTRYKNHGCAAFAREDVEDAKRGAPSGPLDDYAAARGLEMHQRASLAGFRMALPQFAEEQFNLMRGVLPGGRFGILLHQLLQTHHRDGSGDMGGSFHSVRTSDPTSFWKALRPNRTDLPYIGWLMNAPNDDTPSEAFGVAGAWSPITTCATPVPRSVALLPTLRLVRRSRTAWMKTGGAFDLDGHGAPGWRIQPGGRVDEAALQRLVAGPFCTALAELALTYAEVRVDHGMLVLRRHGFVMDPATLDRLGELLAALATAVEDAADTGVRADFAAPLFACPWEHDDAAVSEPYVAGGWSADLRGYAERHGLAMEDPAAWHQGLGHLPVPGRVIACLRHPSGGRVLFTTDVPINVTRALRGVVAAPARAGAADTPPGGLRAEGWTTSVTDGVAIAWTHRHFGYTSEADGLIDAAMTALRAADAV